MRCDVVVLRVLVIDKECHECIARVKNYECCNILSTYDQLGFVLAEL